MKEYQDPEVLRKLYWGESLSLNQIAKKLDVSLTTIFLHMKKHSIERRRQGRYFEEVKQLEPSEDLAYWVGVMQTDGSLVKWKDEVCAKVGVGLNSLPMLEKFSKFQANY